jgi:hypothetical protein
MLYPSLPPCSDHSNNNSIRIRIMMYSTACAGVRVQVCVSNKVTMASLPFSLHSDASPADITILSKFSFEFQLNIIKNIYVFIEWHQLAQAVIGLRYKLGPQRRPMFSFYLGSTRFMSQSEDCCQTRNFISPNSFTGGL